MKKKKLVIFLLVAIMILTLAVTALVGCNNKNDDDSTKDTDVAPEGYKTMTKSLSSALGEALYNSAEDELINNIKASAQLKVSTKYGDSTNEYLIKFGANVALNTADNNTTTFGLSIVDAKANNANILNIYYAETLATSESDKLGRGDLYVDLGNGDNMQNFAIKGLSIKTVMKSEEVDVSNTQAEEINETVQDALGDVFGYLNTASALGKVYQSNDNSEILLRLDVSSILNGAGEILDALEIIDEYTDQLGLALKSTDIKNIVPGLTIDLSFKLEGAGADNFTDAKFAGVDAKLGISSKDIRLQRTDGSDFIRINIAKDCEVGLALDFAFGEDASNPPRPLAATSAYTNRIGAINFAAEGELTLNEAIGVSINLKGKDIPLEIPAGTYNIEVAADIDPTQLIGVKFNVNTKKISEILNLIVNVSKAINVLSIKITNTDTTVESSLDVAIRDGNVYLNDLSLLGELGSLIPQINGLSIQGTIDALKTADIIPEDKVEEEDVAGSGDASGNVSGNVSGNTSGETASGNDVDLAPIADLIKNLTLIVNDGKISVEVKNHTVNTNADDLDDTTINVKAEASKNGLTLDASILNIVLNAAEERFANVAAKVEVNSNGITITAKSATALDKDAAEIDFGSGIKMKIDLVLKLTKFEYGKCPK